MAKTQKKNEIKQLQKDEKNKIPKFHRKES